MSWKMKFAIIADPSEAGNTTFARGAGSAAETIQPARRAPSRQRQLSPFV
jgi:hypothetical protein